MSVLANVGRTFPAQRTTLACVKLPRKPHTTVRCMAGVSKSAPGVQSQPGYLKKNEDKARRTRKPVPPSKPLPESQLSTFRLTELPAKPKIPLFEPKLLAQERSIGGTTSFDVTPSDPIRAFGVPRDIQRDFQLLSKPHNVVREVTATTLKMLESKKDISSRESRIVLAGPSGCGKSFLLLQAVEWCIRNKWIVIYIPRAKTLVNSSTPYTYDIRSQTYLQPAFAFQTLQRMLNVNAQALGKIPLVEDLPLERTHVPAGTTLAALIDIAIKERVRTTAQAPLILEAVMKSLEAQTSRPVLFAVDNVQALYGNTLYRDPHFRSVAPYHLSMPRLIMEYASGKRAFSKGVFLSAISRSDTQFPLGLELRDALGLEYDHPTSPYDKRSKELLTWAQGLQKFDVPDKLTLKEAASLFEIWKNENMLPGKTYDEMFMAKYTESAGNPKDFVWKGLLATLGA